MHKNILLAIICIFLTACNDKGNKASDAGSFGSENTIRASIFVNDIPTLLTIDHAEIESGRAEYEWSVTFDINGDSIVGEKDIVFSISEDKQAGEVERELEFSKLEARLLQYEDEDTLYIKGVIDYEVNDNVLTFIADRNLHEDLKKITLTTQVNIMVYKDTPTADSMDYLPEYGVYTQMQDTSLISDDLLDFHGDDDASDISRFELEIIE